MFVFFLLFDLFKKIINLDRNIYWIISTQSWLIQCSNLMQTSHSFESNILNESVKQVHKTGLNDSEKKKNNKKKKYIYIYIYNFVILKLDRPYSVPLYWKDWPHNIYLKIICVFYRRKSYLSETSWGWVN